MKKERNNQLTIISLVNVLNFHFPSFDFRHLGDSTGFPRQLVSVALQEEDYLSVIRYVSDPSQHETLFGRNTLDPTRVVLWGWSNSGGHVTRLASRTEKPTISAVIALDPLCDGLGNLFYHLRKSPSAILKLSHRVCGDLLAAMFTRTSTVVVPALGPGGFLGSEEAERGAHQITPEGGPPFVNSVAARYALDVIFNRAQGATVRCPILVSWSRDGGDGLIASHIPQKLADDARAAGVPVDVYEHPGDHFAIHPGGCAFEDTINRQLLFLARTVGPIAEAIVSDKSSL